MSNCKIELFKSKKNYLKVKKLVRRDKSLPIKIRINRPVLSFFKKCLTSIKDDKLCFSNFIFDTISNYNDVLGCDFKNIFRNEKLELNTNGIDLSRENGERIKSIFKLSNDKLAFDKLDGFIYELYVTNGNELDSKGKGTFRIFSVYFQETKEKDSSKFFVFLIDPYHLVCPVSIKGKNKGEEKKIYKKVKEYSCCLNELFEKNCRKEDINKNNVNFIEEEDVNSIFQSF